MSSIATTNTTTNRQDNLTTLPTTPKPQTSKEVIAANVQLLIEQLEAGHSEALTNYLTAMGRFHNYSFGNILEIARQMPEATRVAGLYAWNQLGRKVMKGQKGTLLLSPLACSSWATGRAGRFRSRRTGLRHRSSDGCCACTFAPFRPSSLCCGQCSTNR